MNVKLVTSPESILWWFLILLKSRSRTLNLKWKSQRKRFNLIFCWLLSILDWQVINCYPSVPTLFEAFSKRQSRVWYYRWIVLVYSDNFKRGSFKRKCFVGLKLNDSNFEPIFRFWKIDYWLFVKMLKSRSHTVNYMIVWE